MLEGPGIEHRAEGSIPRGGLDPLCLGSFLQSSKNNAMWILSNNPTG